MPQELASVQVRVWLPPEQVDQEPQDQDSAQAQLCKRDGRLVVVPQEFESVQVRVCEPFAHSDQLAQVQFSTHTELLAKVLKE